MSLRRRPPRAEQTADHSSSATHDSTHAAATSTLAPPAAADAAAADCADARARPGALPLPPLSRNQSDPSAALALQSSLPCALPVPLLERNLILLNVYAFLLGLSFLSPLFVLWMRQALENSTAHVSHLLALQSLSIFLCELPAGIAADLVGRKWCLLGCLVARMAGLGILLLVDVLLPSLSPWSRMLGFGSACALEGLACSLGSGTDVSLLHDSLAALGRPQEFQGYLGYRSMMWPCAAAIANLVGSAAAEKWGVRSCIVATMGATILAIPVTAALREVYPRIYDPVRMWRKSKRSMQTGAKQPPLLRDWDNAAQNQEPASFVEIQPHPTESSAALSALPADSSPLLSTLDSASSSPSLHHRKPRLPLRIECTPSAAATADAADDSPRFEPQGSPLSSLPPPSLENFTSLLRSHLRSCAATLRSRPRLQSLIASAALLYAFGEPVHRLRGVFLAAHKLPSSHFGLVGAAMFGLSSLGALLSTRVRHWSRVYLRLGAMGVVVASSSLAPLLQYAAARFGGEGWLAAVLLLPTSFLWGVRLPLLSHFLHRSLAAGGPADSGGGAVAGSADAARTAGATAAVKDTHRQLLAGQRATLASMQSLSNKLALALCLSLVAGPLTDAYGIDATVQVFAALSALPVLAFILFVRREEECNTQRRGSDGNDDKQHRRASPVATACAAPVSPPSSSDDSGMPQTVLERSFSGAAAHA